MDIKGRKLGDVVTSFAAAVGHPDANLRIVRDDHGLRLLVPSSRSGVPSAWTNFKAAICKGPFSRIASLRAARLEVQSKPLDEEIFNEIVSTVSREEKDVEKTLGVELNGHYSLQAHEQLKGKELCKRNVVAVLDAGQRGIDRYAAGIRMERHGGKTPLLGQLAVTGTSDLPVQKKRTELTRAETLANEGTHLLKKDAPPAARDVSSRNVPAPPTGLTGLCSDIVRQELQLSDPYAIATQTKKLHDNVRDYLIGQNKWPIQDLDWFETNLSTLVDHMKLLPQASDRPSPKREQLRPPTKSSK